VKLQLQFDPAAVRELRSARDWYNKANPGVGDDFVESFWRLTDRLLQSPASSPRRPTPGSNREIRQATLRRFPYLVVYEVRDDALLIIAVAHGRRRPGYWRERVTK